MSIHHPSFRKTACLTMCVGWMLHFTSFSQCLNNMATRSYDTVLTGIGYGNYQVQFPKWSLDDGLLASVKINARVSAHYKFTMKNRDVTPSTYSLWVGREDLISSVAMNHDYDNITEQKIGVFPMDAGAEVSEGPFLFLDNYVNTDSISDNTAPFLGPGNVSFSYSPATYSTLHTNNNSSYYYSAAVQDTVVFSLTYLYCRSGGVLATDLTHFSARLQGPATIQVAWSVAGEQKDRQYQVQRSRDGQHFTTIGIVPAAGSDGAPATGGPADYTYNDLLPGEGTGKWYYRLLITEAGDSSYSTIKEVTVRGNTEGRGLTVYPSPADDFIEVTVDPGLGSGAGWRIELIAPDGRSIQNGNYLSSNNIHIDFKHRLPAGVYFVQAMDLRGDQRYIQRFVKR